MEESSRHLGVGDDPRPKLIIKIPGEPQAQERAGVNTQKGRATFYEPDASKNWKEAARWTIAAAVGKPDAEVATVPGAALEVIVTAVHEYVGTDSDAERTWRTATPDADNIAKCVLDAGNGYLWKDDRQIARLVVEQFTGGADEPPCVIIEVNYLPPC